MFDIKVTRVVKKPIDAVFAILTDHGNYSQFKPVDESILVEQGKTEQNGLGALRKVKLGGMTLHERIVLFEPPYRLGYQIERSAPLRFEHIKGEVMLKEHAEGTEVTWVSQGYIRFPLLGPLLFDRMAQAQGATGFASILKSIEQM